MLYRVARRRLYRSRRGQLDSLPPRLPHSNHDHLRFRIPVFDDKSTDSKGHEASVRLASPSASGLDPILH